MTRQLTIAIDVMGGDKGPLITIPASIKSLQKATQANFILCGDEQQIIPYLSNISEDVRGRIVVEHCVDVVEMDEKPTTALRRKTNSSMRKALELVESGDADACVSAGNTGALLVMAYYVLNTLPGISRPALISTIPNTQNSRVFLLDLGANVSCDAESLFQYAVMGSVLAEEVEKITSPRVALLNVGEEQIKGNDTVKAAADMLSRTEDINYVGYIEGDSLFSGKADVIVTDGFVGNITLKACEGIAKLVVKEAKKNANQNLFTKLLSSIALPLLKSIYHRVNPDQYNGASLLGLRGIVIKSHGNASLLGFQYAIEEALMEVERQVPNKIKDKLETVLVERSV